MIPLTQLTGQNTVKIAEFTHSDGWRCDLHHKVHQPLKRLCRDAQRAGFDLRVASGFRRFDHQLRIWTGKVSGERPVLDADESPLDRADFDDWQWAQAILRWSALPGASRHHWGTEIDVFDANAFTHSDQRLQLTVAETLPNGIMGEFHAWLNEYLSDGSASPWFRPYHDPSHSHSETDHGIASEPWHLSFRPLAIECERALSAEVLRGWLVNHPLPLQTTLLTHFDAIYERFIGRYFSE